MCRQQIGALMLEIRELADDLDLVSPEPPPDPRRRYECEPDDACREPCLLADRICDDARRVCDLSTGCLAGDPWANEQCSTARQGCNGGFARCCDACDAAR